MESMSDSGRGSNPRVLLFAKIVTRKYFLCENVFGRVIQIELLMFDN